MAAEANILAAAKLRAKTPVGSVLNTAEWAEVPLALRDRAFFSAEVEKVRLLQRMQDRVQTALDVLRRPEGAFQTREKFVAEMRELAQAEGLDPRGLGRSDAYGTIKDITSERRLKLIYDQQTQSALEYARWKAEQDPDVLAAYPAQEFTRVSARKKPRVNWRDRWAKAGGKFYGGRMIAAKNAPVWRKLSRFGTPYPPFDFGSGMGLKDISRTEAEKLGLLKRGDPVKPAEEDFNQELEASVADLSPQYRDLLKSTFGEQIRIAGDRASWVPNKVAQAQPIDRRETPAPEVTPGAGLASEPQKATAEEAESLKLPHERATIYDPQGGVMFQKDAAPESPGQVSIDPADYHKLPNSTFSHNHLGASGPSLDDFKFLHAHNLAELRVISTDEANRPVLHRLRRTAAGWQWSSEQARQKYITAADAVARELKREVDAGTMTEAQMNARFEERTLQRLVAENPAAFDYDRTAL